MAQSRRQNHVDGEHAGVKYQNRLVVHSVKYQSRIAAHAVKYQLATHVRCQNKC